MGLGGHVMRPSVSGSAGDTSWPYNHIDSWTHIYVSCAVCRVPDQNRKYDSRRYNIFAIIVASLL